MHPTQKSGRVRSITNSHDYLVHSLREWLTRKQKETRRGRAELRLADRAALWNAKPENRLLPSLWEYLSIGLLTDRAKWTVPERKLMTRARRLHGIRTATFAVVLVGLVFVGLIISRKIEEGGGPQQAAILVNRLMTA